MLALLTVLLTAAAGAGAGGEAARLEGRHVVRGARGGTATLHCLALDAQDTQVSWIRSRDLQILAHGGAVFTADARVSAGAEGGRGGRGGRRHWLRLAPLRGRDAGRYECQLNTEPKQSLFIDLQVLDPEELAAESSTARLETSSGGGEGNQTDGEAEPHTDVMQRDEAAAAAAAAGSTAWRHMLLILLLYAAAAVR